MEAAHDGPDPQGDCAAFAGEKPVQIGPKKSDSGHRTQTKVKNCDEAQVASQMPQTFILLKITPCPMQVSPFRNSRSVRSLVYFWGG